MRDTESGNDPLVLASASPRRSDLLRRAGVAFETVPANVPELPAPDESPEELVRRLAREKALAVRARVGDGRRVLGADTAVVVDDTVLGKPDDPEHAVSMLQRLVGRDHRVLTGVALCEGDRVTDLAVESRVFMRSADERELRSYVATGEPLDKAGAYALQGEGRRFVERVEGSETNVIGLPLEETLALLSRPAGGRRDPR